MNIVGTAGSDILNGTEGDDRINGEGGRDTLNGLGGDDTLDGGSDDDVLDGGSGSDTLIGGTGNDVLIDYFGGRNSLSGNDGDDRLSIALFEKGNDASPITSELIMTGGAGRDVITLGGLNRPTFGTHDISFAINGGDGNDTIDVVAVGNGTIDAGTGSNRIMLRSGGQGSVSILLDAAFGSDLITIQPDAGSIKISGFQVGEAGDRLDLSAISGALSIVQVGDATEVRAQGSTIAVLQAVVAAELSLFNLGFSSGVYAPTGQRLAGSTGNDVLIGWDGVDVLTGGAGNDYLLGAGGSDDLSGGDGADRLNGGSGDDILDGGLGYDRLEGGAGNDTYIIADRFNEGAPDNIVEKSGGGTDTVRSYLETYTLANEVENLILLEGAVSGFGNYSANRITGNDSSNTISGGLGNDILIGNGGSDLLLGGAGNDILRGGLDNDRMEGGAGDDDYYVEDAGDVVIEDTSVAGGTRDRIISLVDYILSDEVGVETLTLANNVASALNLTGNAYANTLNGNELANILSGGGGDDRLDGGLGNDTLIGGDGSDYLDGDLGNDRMEGGAGDDVYIVNSNGDVVVELPNEGFDTIRSSIGIGTMASGIERLILTGTQNIGATGNADSNVIIGNIGSNRLSGGAGDDQIAPGGGNNIVDGGVGLDTLVLTGVRSSYTVIENEQAVYLVGEEGAHRVSNIEQVRFADGSIIAWPDVVKNMAAFDGLRYIAGYSDLRAAFGINAAAGTQHFVASGFGEGRDAMRFDPFAYVASYADLRITLGANARAASEHFILTGAQEGRATSFDAASYIASYSDLIAAFSTEYEAGARHYIMAGAIEGRTPTFNAVRYLASYGDLIETFGSDSSAATSHYILSGFGEGRQATFDGALYVASNMREIGSLGLDADAAARHYVTTGYGRGLSTASFDAARYAASYQDLALAFGSDLTAATRHYVTTGFNEGRLINFDALDYVATYVDLAKAFGTDTNAATQHYLRVGAQEGRQSGGFDEVAYLLSNEDLGRAGLDARGALVHWVVAGVNEGRSGDAPFGREQVSHQLAANGRATFGKIDQGGDLDWFQFTANGGDTVQLRFESNTLTGRLDLYDRFGRLIESDVGVSDGELSFEFQAQSSGAYYLVVSAGPDAQSGGYSVAYEIPLV